MTREKLQIFISGHQQDMQYEREIVDSLIKEDVFLSQHCTTYCFEKEPASGKPPEVHYRQAIKKSKVYIGLFSVKYGDKGEDGLSATHREYRIAKELGLEILIFIRDSKERKDAELIALLREISHYKTGHKRRKFRTIKELQIEVRKSLLAFLKSQGFEPKDRDLKLQQIQQSSYSNFDLTPVKLLALEDLKQNLVQEFVVLAMNKPVASITNEDVIKTLTRRQLMVEVQGKLCPTVAGALLLGLRPEEVLPQARVTADVYTTEGINRTERLDYLNLVGPIPDNVEALLQFFKKNIRTSYEIVGFERVIITEYPLEALREAIVNAMAHRDYKLQGMSIRIEIFRDRIIIQSPGHLPPPLTLAQLRKGVYHPVSRNSRLARAVTFFKMGLEEKGTGILRMKNCMLNHGLTPPEFDYVGNEFRVTLYGPGKDWPKKIKVRETVFSIPQSKLAELNDRQREMTKILLKGETLTSRKCKEIFKTTRDTTVRDLKLLMKLKIARKVGSGRSTHYVLGEVS